MVFDYMCITHSSLMILFVCVLWRYLIYRTSFSQDRQPGAPQHAHEWRLFIAHHIPVVGYATGG